MEIFKIERYLGSMLGLACGDALGAPLELTISGMFNPVSDMIDDRRSNIVKAGMWTDDTSMALCLAESIIERNFFDPVNQMEKYCKWHRHGYLSSAGRCFGIGRSTENALLKFSRTGDPICGETSPRTAGNGSIMRLCPVPLAFGNLPELALKHAETMSKTTHAAQECIDACRLLSSLIIGCLQNKTKEEILAKDFRVTKNLLPNPSDNSNKIKNILNGSYKNKNHLTIKSSGYVVDTLESALWAFHNSNNFEEGALKAVNLGGDADTVGAVYGQLAGAYYGYKNIPEKWINKISMKDKIIDLAKGLYNFSEKNK